MLRQLVWSHQEDRLLLSGTLDKYLLNDLWKIRYKIIKGINFIDISAISKIDTAGLTLLVYLIALSKNQGLNITILNIQNKVLSLAQLYNLPIELLPYN